MFRLFKVREHERGLLFREGAFMGVLEPRSARHKFFDPLRKLRLDLASTREVRLAHKDLELIVRSGELEGEAKVLDLKDHERALVWVDGRFEAILGPGLHALWTVFRRVRTEVVDTRAARLEHPELDAVLGWGRAGEWLNVNVIEAGHVGVLFVDGRLAGKLGPGRHAFWKNAGKATMPVVDLRESVLDVAGQEIMTADKVTLRLNAVVVFRVTDPERSVTAVDDRRQALFREAQLALRAVIGTRELDTLLAEKDAVAAELEGIVRARVASFGLEVVRLGIRDVILPGEMKDLLNQVTQARKAAEASLITRREETAAMRAQANTAKLLETTPLLMRLRELEVLEKVAGKANLTVVLGEGGLADRVVKLL